jgi:hypothetical protein
MDDFIAAGDLKNYDGRRMLLINQIIISSGAML